MKIAIINGPNLNDSLNGTTAADSIFGFGGNDTLSGSGGDDEIVGGSGDDSYTVVDSGDLVHEIAGEGTDRVEVWNLAAYTLAANVERARRSLVVIRNGHGGAGAGIIVRSDGLIITNAHVIAGASKVIEKNLDDASNRKLVEGYLSSIGTK